MKQVRRVSPSRRAEGSRAKPVAKRVSPSMRKEGSKRVAPARPSRIVESGVGNPLMAASRAFANYLGKPASVASKPATQLAGSTRAGVSRATGGALKGGKPAKYGPSKKTLTPQQKAAQTRAMNKAKARYAAEGPKKSVAKKPAAKGLTKRQQAAGAGAAGAATVGAAGVALSRGKKTNSRGSSSKRGEWTGTGWKK